MKLFSLAIFCFIVLAGCSSDEDTLNSAKLKSLVTAALNGDQNANISLSGLIDKKHAKRVDYNQLSIDSSYMNRKYYYSLLLEYPEPTLNLFAIYDNTMRFYLLDKSLNGNIKLEWIQHGTKNFCFVQERFLTKDVLTVDRLSMYFVKDTNATLVYRELSRLVKDKDTVSQAVTKIIDHKIVTRIGGKTDVSIYNRTDTFYYNQQTKSFLSKTDLFKDFVKKEIKNFRWIPIKPQLVSAIFDEGTIQSGEGYQIYLDESWRRISQDNQMKYLRENLIGDRYINESLSTNISILKLPDDKRAENYLSYRLGESTTGKYKMRSTQLIGQGNYLFQIFEHSCGKQTFLLVFECLRSTYDKNKMLYDDIINSFFIECQ
jgi:hypothetical protein